jgi:hypothetical protein
MLAYASLNNVQLGGISWLASVSLRGASLSETLLLADASLFCQFERSFVTARRPVPFFKKGLSLQHVKKRSLCAVRLLTFFANE